MILERICSVLGIDCLQFRRLLKVHILLDFRSTKMQSSSRSSSRIPGFLITLIFYGIIGLFASLSGMRLFDSFGYSLVSLSVSMVLIAMAVIIEFNEIIINPDDAEILAYRPIDSRTYFWVKMVNLLFYITLFGAALNLPPAFVGLAYAEHGPAFPAVYLLVAWLAQVTLASFVIVLYSLLVRWLNYEKLKDVLAYVQVVFSFIVFVGYQFLARLTPHMQHTQVSGIWIYFAPPAYFAGLIEVLYGSLHPENWILAALGAIFSVAILGFATRNLSLNYAQTIYKLSQTSRVHEKEPERGAVGFWSQLVAPLLRDPEERVGYNLVSKYIRRNRNMRMRIFPAFAMPLAVLGMFIMDGEIVDPFLQPNVPTFMAFIFLIYLVVFFYQIIPTSDHWQASWIFRVAPVSDYSKIYRGAMKALVLKYVTPYFILIFAVLSTQMAVQHAFLLAILNYVIFVAYTVALTALARDLPLSKRFERGQSNLRFTLTFVLFPLFIFVGLFEYIVCQYPVLYPFAIFLLLVLIRVIGGIAARMYKRRIGEREIVF